VQCGRCLHSASKSLSGLLTRLHAVLEEQSTPPHCSLLRRIMVCLFHVPLKLNFAKYLNYRHTTAYRRPESTMLNLIIFSCIIRYETNVVWFCWLVGWLVGWLLGWLVGWLAYRSVGWRSFAVTNFGSYEIIQGLRRRLSCCRFVHPKRPGNLRVERSLSSRLICRAL
jgi:hypothetical protein